MKNGFPRWTILCALTVMALGGAANTAVAQDYELQPTDMIAFNCETDPGDLGAPETWREGELEANGCVPAEGVAVTLHSAEYDWRARCDTGADGICQIEGPGGRVELDIVLEGAVHEATVAPGYAPVEPIFEEIIYGEFSSHVIVNLPVDGDAPTDRQILSANVATCAVGSDPAADSCERLPTADTLLKVAETTDGPLTDVPWLAPNAEGFVGFDIGALETGTLTMLVDHLGEARFACTDLDSGERITTNDGDPGAGDSFVIELTPISDGDIRCDVTLLGTIATPISQAH